MDFGSMIGGAGVGIAADLGSAFLNNRFATAAAHRAQDFSAQQYATRYQTQVRDLRAAGLNPMLAYAQSPGGGPSGVSSSASTSNMRASINESKIASAQASVLEEEAKNKEFERDNLKAMWWKIDSEFQKNTKELREIEQRTATGKASEQESIRRKELMDAQERLLQMQIAATKQDIAIKRPEEVVSSSDAANVLSGMKRIFGSVPMLGNPFMFKK